MNERSGALGPVAMQAGEGLVLAHRCHVGLGEFDPRDQQVHEVGGEGLLGWFGCSAIGFDAIVYAGPELWLGDVELITENVLPQARPVVGPIYRMRDSSTQNPTVGKAELVGHVRARSAAGVPDPAPFLDLAEGLVVLAGRLRPVHRVVPTSQSRN